MMRIDFRLEPIYTSHRFLESNFDAKPFKWKKKPRIKDWGGKDAYLKNETTHLFALYGCRLCTKVRQLLMHNISTSDSHFMGQLHQNGAGYDWGKFLLRKVRTRQGREGKAKWEKRERFIIPHQHHSRSPIPFSAGDHIGAFRPPVVSLKLILPLAL